MGTALGALEIYSIAKGVEAADAMLKAAEVQLLSVGTVCAGKYVVVVVGDVAAVKASVAAGETVAGTKSIDSLVIANVHEQVPRAVNAMTEISELEAVGTVELFSVCAALLAADTAVKAARVQLLEVRLGRGLGGKSFLVLTGDVASVRAAVETARTAASSGGMVSDCTVVPAPHPDLVRALL